MRLSRLLLAQLGVGVEDLNVELLSSLNNLLSNTGRNVVGDLSGIRSVVHQEHLELLDVVDNELVEARGEQVSGSLVGA